MRTKITKEGDKFYITIPKTISSLYDLSEEDKIDFQIVEKGDHLLINISLKQKNNNNHM